MKLMFATLICLPLLGCVSPQAKSQAQAEQACKHLISPNDEHKAYAECTLKTFANRLPENEREARQNEAALQALSEATATAAAAAGAYSNSQPRPITCHSTSTMTGSTATCY